MAGEGAIKTENASTVLEIDRPGTTVVSSSLALEAARDSVIRVNEKTALPWLVVDSQRSGEGISVRSARPFLALKQAIRWDAGRARHVAEFLFGLDSDQGASGPLTQPLLARFAVSCDGVEPAQVRLTKVGAEGYDEVRVLCSARVKNERAKHSIDVLADHGRLSYPFEIPRRPGPLTLVSSAARPAGIGFEQFELIVTNTEEDGTPLAATAPETLQLIVHEGDLEAPSLTLQAGQSEARVGVRANGLRPLRISAVAGARRSGEIRVEPRFPWSLLAAILLGGTLGGVLSAQVNKQRRKKLLRHTLEGMGVGLLISIVSVVVPGFAAVAAWVTSSEVGFFAVSSIAAFAGTHLLELAVKAMFPALSDAKKPATT
ncbi:MAG TPA: hypothetical protein VFZ61_04925 [Polyangiales bacterium]